MKSKKKLRIIQILCIISLIITIVSIQKTYARYFEKIDTTYDSHIKRWLIKVNDNIIHDATSLSEVIQPVIIENDNMNNNNTLVPGRIGYFDIVIDYTYVDLVFSYEFSIEQLNNNKLADFEIYGYQIMDEEDVKIIESKEIKGVIDPTTKVNNANEKKCAIRVWFRWNDGDDNIMNNKADTQFKGEDNTNEQDLHKQLKYKANLKFVQYIQTEEQP